MSWFGKKAYQRGYVQGISDLLVAVSDDQKKAAATESRWNLGDFTRSLMAHASHLRQKQGIWP